MTQQTKEQGTLDRLTKTQEMVYELTVGEVMASKMVAVGTTVYALCVYDQTANSSVLKMATAVGPGGICGSQPCWKALSDKGWVYKSKLGNGYGITKMRVKAGAAGKPQIQMRAKGSSLPMPAPVSGTNFFDQDPAVIVQLHSSNPANCWSSTFDDQSTKKNDGVQFKAVTP